MSGTFQKISLTAVRNMILVIHLVILVLVSKDATGNTTTECKNINDANKNIKLAEELLQVARKKIPTNCQAQLPTVPIDCEEILKNGETKSGIYRVWPNNRIISGSISVYCDMDTEGGGWTVIQRRGNFGRLKDYFYQDWKTYKEGFGNLEEDFWLGNDNIYALTNQKSYSIRFDLGDFDGFKKFAKYDKFWIEEESNNYALHVAGYTGDAGDSFSYHDGCKFTTKDRDNDKLAGYNCAYYYKGGWWYNKCHYAHLNGVYPEGKKVQRWHSLQWKHWKGDYESLATSEMKIRRSRSV